MPLAFRMVGTHEEHFLIVVISEGCVVYQHVYLCFVRYTLTQQERDKYKNTPQTTSLMS